MIPIEFYFTVERYLMFIDIDVLAERIRALGCYAAGSFAEFLELNSKIVVVFPSFEASTSSSKCPMCIG